MELLSSQPFSYGLGVSIVKSQTDLIFGGAQNGANREELIKQGRHLVSAALNLF
jgi:hypothetical protein